MPGFATTLDPCDSRFYSKLRRLRRGRARQVTMVGLLLLFGGIIAGYLVLTDPDWVKGRAESALSEILGGRVTVDRASLSIFEGLKLSGVTLSADDGGGQLDAVIFTADRIWVRVDLAALLQRRIEPRQIVAVRPVVHLTENLDTGRWNFQRLATRKAPEPPPAPRPERPARPPAVPEILLRAAQVQYSEIRGGVQRRAGGIAIDGLVTPVAPHIYKFDFESRSIEGPAGPRVRGLLDTRRKVVMAGMSLHEVEEGAAANAAAVAAAAAAHASSPTAGAPAADAAAPPATSPAATLPVGAVVAGAHGFDAHVPLIGEVLSDSGEAGRSSSPFMEGFEFGDVIRVMLPAQVQDWWVRHGLDGRISIPRFFYHWGDKPSYQVEVQVEGVRLGIPPEELLGDVETRRLRQLRAGLPPARLPAAVSLIGEAHISLPPTVAFEQLMPPQSVELYGVSGRFVFTPERISFANVKGRIEGNPVIARGTIHGYSPDVPLELSLSSHNLWVPLYPRYVPLLPRDLRKIWSEFLPSGHGSLQLHLARRAGEKDVDLNVELTLNDGNFAFHELAYPLRNATGKVRYARDARTRKERVELVDIRGYGLAGTANERRLVSINGFIAPLDRTNQVEVRIGAAGIHLDEHVRRTLPPEARDVIALFDHRGPDGSVVAPARLSGDFAAHVSRPLGLGHRTAVHVDLDLHDAAGSFVEFPYPFQKGRGRVEIRDAHAVIRGFTARAGGEASGDTANRSEANGDGADGAGRDATLRLDGTVSWSRGGSVEPDLRISARDVPVDEKLKQAMPRGQREWIERVGIGGTLDVDGRIFALKGPRPARRPASASGDGDDDPVIDADAGWITPSEPPALPPRRKADVGFALDMRVRDGTVWRVGDTHAVTDVEASLHLTHDGLEIRDLRGVRGSARVTGRGRITWPGGRPLMDLEFHGADLALDDVLRQVVPETARRVWRELRPTGRIDLGVRYVTGDPDVLSWDSSTNRVVGGRDDSYAVSIIPRGASMLPRLMPWELTDVRGEAIVTPSRIRLVEMSARHGDSKLRLDGVGVEREDGSSEWTLAVGGTDVVVDQPFLDAVPRGVATLLNAIEYRGKLSFEAPKFIYRTWPTEPTAVTAAVAAATPAAVVPPAPGAGPTPATRPSAEVEERSEITFGAAIQVGGGSMDLGLKLTDVHGKVNLDAVSIVDGRVRTLKGNIAASTLQVAGRPASEFRSDVVKPATADLYQFANLAGRVAGGEMAGQVELLVPKDGSNQYAVNLVLRDCDVRQIAGEVGEKVKGRVTASLALQGDWSDPKARRGRGDIHVQGNELYRVPVLLGLLQITNLSLPIKSPFNDATTQYIVEGQRITFESITIRSRDMLMQGSGHLDFGTRKVSLSFTTDNPNRLDLPVLGPLIQEVRRELMQIHVRGTVTEPKVSAKSFESFSTTVDEVFKGRDQPPRDEDDRRRRRSER